MIWARPVGGDPMGWRFGPGLEGARPVRACYKHHTHTHTHTNSLSLPSTHPPPPTSWAFLSWLLDDRKLKFFEQAAAFALFVRGVSVAINVISATRFVKFLSKKRRKKDRKASMWERLTKAP